jgi:hypothetical protein
VRVVLSLAHVLTDNGTNMPKQTGVMSVLLYVDFSQECYRFEYSVAFIAILPHLWVIGAGFVISFNYA